MPKLEKCDPPRVLTIANPQSGAFAKCGEALNALQSAGPVFEVISAGDLPKALTEAARLECERIVVIGGDGTMSRLINSLGQNLGRYELAILPAGTGNDLARSLGLTLDDPLAACNLALTGMATPLDVLCHHRGLPEYILNAVTCGFGGQIAAETGSDEKSRWGRLAYWLKALSKLGDLPQYQLEILADGECQKHTALGLWISNGRYIGGGFPIAPTAELDDGLLEVTILPAMATLDLLSAGIEVTLGGVEQAGTLIQFQARQVQIRSSPPLPLSIDGESAESAEWGCRIMPGTIRVVSASPEILANSEPLATSVSELPAVGIVE